MADKPVGRLVEAIPIGGGKTLDLRDASDVPGVACEIHDQSPTVTQFLAMVSRPQGVNACPECVATVRARVHR
jgi:hypothetical protein